MDDDYRGLDSEIFTLIVGQEKKQLFVQKDILTKIPYFNKALSSGKFTESETHTFNLPDDAPKAVADVIYYAHTGQLSEIVQRKRDIAHLERCLHAYIVADKYKAEEVANSYVNAIIEYHKEEPSCQIVVNPSTVAILGSAGHRENPLYDLCIRDMVYHLHRGHYQDWDVRWSASDEEVCDFEGALERMPQLDLKRVVLATNGMGLDKDNGLKRTPSPMRHACTQLCIYHKHDLTEKCKIEAGVGSTEKA